MKKFKIITIILLTLNLILVAVAIILSSISLSKHKYTETYSSSEVGFNEIFSDQPIEKMYVHFQMMSHKTVEFYDEDIINELKEIVKNAVFQKKQSENASLLLGDTSLAFYTEDKMIDLGIDRFGSLYIRTKDSEVYYKTNVAREVYDLAYKAAYLYIPEEDRHVVPNDFWSVPEGLEE